MLTICDHPIITHRLNMMRDKNASPLEFRKILKEVSLFLLYEASRDFKQKEVKIETPLETMNTLNLTTPSPVLVSILRAGNGLLDGALEVFPKARVGFLGMYRDEETLRPVDYYSNLPQDLESAPVIVLDPMLATGHSALGALKHLRDLGAKDLRMVTLLCAPEGVDVIHKYDPNIPIVTAAVDRELSDKGYILPGLGDAGDRIFNSL